MIYASIYRHIKSFENNAGNYIIIGCILYISIHSAFDMTEVFVEEVSVSTPSLISTQANTAFM